MLRQRFWRSFYTGLFAVLLIGQSVFIRAKAETSTLGYWVVTAEAAGLNDQAQTMYNYVLHIYTMHDDARGNVSGTYSTMGGNNQTFTNITFYGRETTVNLYSGATNTIGNTIRGNDTFSYFYTGDEQVVEFSQDQWEEITQHFNDMVTALGNIDNLIDNISWEEQGEIVGYSTTKEGTYTNDVISNNQESIYFKLNPGTYTSNRLIKIETKITNATRTSAGNLGTIITDWQLLNISTGAYSTRVPNVFYLTNGPYLTIFVYSNISTASNYSLIVKVSGSNRNLRVAAGRNSSISYINSDDIEYWHLLYYLSEMNKQEVIINNQQTIISQQNSFQQYNQQEYNTENNDDQTNDIEGFMVDYDNKLGFIGQSFEFITSLFGVITNADISTTIPFPGVTVPIGENGSNVTLIQAQNVDIVPNGLSNIFEYVRLANSMILVSAVFNMAINKYKEWSMK